MAESRQGLANKSLRARFRPLRRLLIKSGRQTWAALRKCGLAILFYRARLAEAKRCSGIPALGGSPQSQERASPDAYCLRTIP